MYNSNNTTCIITINCKNVNRYYCRAPCHIFTNPLHIKHAFGKVNKTHNMFRMFLAENQFKMMLTNNTTDSNELNEIPIAIEEKWNSKHLNQLKFPNIKLNLNFKMLN